MHTGIKWNQLKGLPKEQQLKLLASAIDFEMKKPVLAAEMLGHAVLGSGKARVVGADIKTPGLDRGYIKSFLAQKYNTTDDNPILNDISNQMEQFFHTNMPEIDVAYTVLFNLRDLRGSTHDHFDIINTNAGITFTQRKPGEPINIRRNISEDKTPVSYLEFADGLGLLDQWLQYNQFWNIDEAIAEFRANYYDKKASTHYELFTDLGAGVNQAFATDDVTTANNAMAAILRAVQGSGYGVSTNATFYALCSVEYVGRLEKMLTAQRGSAIVNAGTVSQPLTVRIGGIIGTTHISAATGANGWFLVLPGHKIQRGEWMDLSVEDARNIYVSATDLVGRGQYNAAIGDSNQVKRCAWS